MTTPQHAAWISRGEPWRLARPLLALRDRLRGYGYTVYDLGDNHHLDAEPPEHHAPYSESNWPSFQGQPMPDVVTAIDIMPPEKPGLPSLQLLGAQLFADKQAGLPEAAWVVDMNWGPSSDRTAVRDTWRPGHARTSSGDTGHIHLSCRSDAIDSPAGDLYDPVARLRGQTGDDMQLSPEEHALLETAAWRLDGIAAGKEVFEGPSPFVKGKPNELRAQLDRIEHALAGAQVTPTDAQWAALTAALEQKVETAAEAAAERALRRVLGGLDGSSPTA